MHWYRIDNRLVHGQIIEAWIPFTDVRDVIVANDALAQDILQQQIISLAIPQRVHVHFVPVDAIVETLAKCGGGAFVLVENCHDAARLCAAGASVQTLNVGNLHYSEGKHQLLPHVAVTAEEEDILCAFIAQGIKLDFRSVPNEMVRGLDARFL